jgi:hypothetical protein
MRMFLRLGAKVSDRFSEKRININFFFVKLSLEMKHGAFNMIPKENTKVFNANIRHPTAQESSHGEITNEDNAHYFL